MDLKELPVIGTVATVAALVGDLVLAGGDVILSFLVFAIVSPDLWLSIVVHLETLASRLEWLPRWIFEDLLIVGVSLLVVFYTARFIREWRREHDG